MLELRHGWWWLLASAVLVGVVVWGSLETGTDIPGPPGFDKVEHLTVYLALALWFTGLVHRGRYWLVVCGLLALGASMEALQYAMHAGRTADVLDMAANTAGIAAGIAIAVLGSGGWARKVEAWLIRS